MTQDKGPAETFLTEMATVLEQVGRPTPEVHVLTHGRRFSSQALSPTEKEVLGGLKRRDNPPSQCYANAQRLAIRLLGRIPPKVQTAYCEGYVCWRTSIALPHAWLSINDKVVDPTLRWDNGRPVLGRIPPHADYIGVQLQEKDLLHVCSHRQHTSLLDDWECGWPQLQEAPAT